MNLQYITGSRNIRRARVQTTSVSFQLGVLLVSFFVVSCFGVSTKQNGNPIDYLDENSVVLITGAAGFIGSELALALHRTYSPKRIICVDRMGDHPSSQEELALFEFQRQRAFHVMQTLGPKGTFYRVDFRPMIPEYFDVGEVPVLDHIFMENTDITHIVHLADPFPHSAIQAVPREKDVPKAGMIEALLEQLLVLKRKGAFVPHFSYASSYEVYPYATDSKVNPLTETQTISAPSSLRGASKLIDETLAKLYFDDGGLFSIGLRFFSVYGPWSAPGSPLFEMAERAVAGQLPSSDPHWMSMQDFVYIDDAIDAVMTAMQFRPQNPHPLVINVGTGQGSSLNDIAAIMRNYFPQKANNDLTETSTVPKTVAFASMERAEEILGYRPRVLLREGVVKLLAWHLDRAYPYGGYHSRDNDKSDYVASQGIVSCLPTDAECLKATPVFPCASECSHEGQCTNSFYDDIVGWTQTLTSKCTAVLYTVALDPSLDSIPSSHVKVQTTSESFLDGNCNLAFVSETSPLVQTLRGSSRIYALMGNERSRVLRTGKWILIPVLRQPFTMDNENVLDHLPKLSPGLFFGSNVKRAIYVDPDILLDSIPKLLQEAEMQPYNPEVDGATAMLIGRGKSKNFFVHEHDDIVPKKQILQSTNSIVQNSAYRMVHIAVSDKLIGEAFSAQLDSRWMIHMLHSDDSRLFRCDIFGELVQWDVDTDRSALEFVLGLHDMWSRVIAEKPWWTDNNVVTVPEGEAPRRRLEQEDDEVEEASNDDDEVPTVKDGESTDPEDEVTGGAGFGIKGEDVEEVAAGEKNGGASSDQYDDQVSGEEGEEKVEDVKTYSLPVERDVSTYDTWMGVLSASSVKYFVRIVPSSKVGVISLEDYENSRLEPKYGSNY